MELLKVCTETGYDRNVAYAMSLLRKYVEEFVPLTAEDIKEKQLYANILTQCTKHVEARTEGVAMYIYKSITGEDSDKPLRLARKHLGLGSPPSEVNRNRAKAPAVPQEPFRQGFRSGWAYGS